MSSSQPRSGYTLPVFAAASAVAALLHLKGQPLGDNVTIDLIDPDITVNIPIEQVAKIAQTRAIAITLSDPGDNLDITRHTPIWAVVKFLSNSSPQNQIIVKGGEGIGRQIDRQPRASINNYARSLLHKNLKKYLAEGEQIEVTIVLPEGKKLAKRTSNEAFGIVEGLSLIGTTGISRPLSAPQQLENYQEDLAIKAKQFDRLVFCIGENGGDLAAKMGINPEKIVKTANWIGPMLISAALKEVKEILLFGYHGKLIKLAGGIFHTHHQLADGRMEIFTAHLAILGLSAPKIRSIWQVETTEQALEILKKLDREENSNWVEKLYNSLATTIDRRAGEYIYKHSQKKIKVGSLLFDRQRQIILTSQSGQEILRRLC